MTYEEWQKRLNEYYATLTPSEQSDIHFDPRYAERHEGTTPLGGDYSIAYYYDERHEPCEKAKAKYVNIVIYDNEDKRVNEVYGTLD